MTKKNKRLLLWRLLLGVLIVCNMVMVFWFSSQNGEKSSALSEKVTILLVEIFAKDPEPTTPPANDTDTEIPVPPENTDSTDSTEPPVTEPPVTEPTEPPVTDPIEPPTTDPTEPEQGGADVEETTPPAQEPEPEDPMEGLTEEEKALVMQTHTPIRKLAHFLEFASLGALVLLLLTSWSGKLWWRYAASLGFALIYAISDELHQLFRDGRGAQVSDVVTDFVGAFTACTLLLVIVIVIRYGKRLVTTYYDLPILPNGKPLCIGLVSDLHACPHDKLLARLRAESPDVILLAGDIMEDCQLVTEGASGYDFLRACADIAPTYYAFGNHETVGSSKKAFLPERSDFAEIRTRITATGVTLLYDESVLWNGIRICGLSSGLCKKQNKPNEKALQEFANASEFRILLCHHPEYYKPYIKNTSIDLTVCGHAHGGQWRILGRGIYAPGQGIFPKYTAGVVDGRCVISRGTGDHTVVPRIANPRELVIIRCNPKDENK